VLLRRETLLEFIEKVLPEDFDVEKAAELMVVVPL